MANFEDLIAKIESLTVVELAELVKKLEAGTDFFFLYRQHESLLQGRVRVPAKHCSHPPDFPEVYPKSLFSEWKSAG